VGESHYREFKSGLEGKPESKQARSANSVSTDVAETLVAFANADGGELFVGVEDDSTVSGVPESLLTGAARQLIDTAHERLVMRSTPLIGVQRHSVTIDDKTVMYFRVRKSTTQIHQLTDGRCLRRQDLASIPFSADALLFDRREVASREYDREFVDDVSVADLDLALIQRIAHEFARGIMAERFLQQYDLADFGSDDLKLRRAAVMLFGKETAVRRLQTLMELRIVEVDGTTLEPGKRFRVRREQTIHGNVLTLLEKGWDELRPFLAFTRYAQTGRFQQTILYPEDACREAVINAVAHRDYSQLGKGIEIYVFSDRLEVKSPGQLLSTVSLGDLQSANGAHESRNTLLCRVLRDIGYMRELGEGIRRMFAVMRSGELVPPEFVSQNDSFSTIFSQRTHYSPVEQQWLEQYSNLSLTREQRAIIALGAAGEAISPQTIFDTVGIIDTEHYRKLVESLQKLGLLVNSQNKAAAARQASRMKVSVRSVPRFRVVLPNQAQLAVALGKPTLNERKAPKMVPGLPDATPIKQRYDLARLDSGELFVSNLEPLTTDGEIVEALAALGISTPESLYVPRYYGQSKGYCFIGFESASERKKLLSAAAEALSFSLG